MTAPLDQSAGQIRGTRNIRLMRLTPDEPDGWYWWPEFERRVRAAALRFTPDVAPEKIIAHLRLLWAQAPLSMGAWLLLQEPVNQNGHMPIPRAVGHLLAWVMKDDWGEMMILVYHLIVDRRVRVTSALDDGLAQLEAWRGQLNALYAAQQAQMVPAPATEAIRRYQYWTVRGSKAWERYFGRRVNVQAVRAVMTFEISPGR